MYQVQKKTYFILLTTCFPLDSSAFLFHAQSDGLFLRTSSISNKFLAPIPSTPQNQYHVTIRSTAGSGSGSGNDDEAISPFINDGQSSPTERRKWINRWNPKLMKLQTYLFPPIPFQDTTHLAFHQHFRPRFVARETLLGVRIMMRIYCVLIWIGWIVEMSTSHLPNLPLAPLESFSQQSPIHVIDILAKQFLWEKLPQLPIAFRLTIIGPILEEISYRGIGFWTCYWDAWLLLFLWSSCAGFFPFLAALWMSHNAVVYLVEHLTTLVLGGAPILEIMKFGWLSIGPLLLQLPLRIRILQTARHFQQQKVKNNNKNGDTELLVARRSTKWNQSGCFLSIPYAHQMRCNRIVERITRTRSIPSPDETIGGLEGHIQSVLLRTTRWRTSSLFAAAHVPCKGSSSCIDSSLAFISSGDQYTYIRKFLGVFCSSLMVESRLVSQRGTIWGACGAHMCFNALTLYRLAIESFLMDLGISFGVVVIPLFLVVGQSVLDRLGKRLGELEDAMNPTTMSGVET